MKKILSFTLALIFILSALAACTPDVPEETDDLSSESVGETESSSVVLFTKGEATSYKIIYADESKALTQSAAQGLAYQLKQKFKLEDISCDKEYAEWGLDPDPYEILIGNTTRPETEEAKKLLTGKKNEYVIKLFENGKIAIVGSNEKSLREGVTYFTEAFVVNATDTLSIEKNYVYTLDLGDDFASGKWTLSAPQYKGGTYASSVYNIGPNISLSSASNGGKMQVIYDTAVEEFNAYLDDLKADGYSELGKSEYNGNVYAQFKKDTKLVYTYYTAAFREARVIDDYSSCTEAEFEYTYTPKEGETTTYYQYGMMHDPAGAGEGQNCDGKWGNAGAFDIIKLADNKLILIDGGGGNQVTNASTAALVDFLHEITGTDKTEKIEIAAWYVTHAHGDHYQFARRLFSTYKDHFILERVMHNLPTSGVVGIGNDLTEIGTNVIKNYPDAKFMKLHTGQNITLGNVNIDVLMTHEDSVISDTGRSNIADGNNACPVLKFNVGEQSIMYFGDWGGNDQRTTAHRDEYKFMEERLLAPYEIDGKYPILKADILQTAHHAINNWLDKVYAAVHPSYAFFTQADVPFDKLQYPCYKDIINELRGMDVEDKNMFFAGKRTNWLVIAQDGTITHGWKKLEGATNGYYYYVNADGQTLYKDADGNINVDKKGSMITDSTGTQVIEGATAKYQKGYWDYVNDYCSDYWYNYGGEE